MRCRWLVWIPVTFALAGCAPYPVNPGYVSMPGGRSVAMDFSLYGGGGAELDEVGSRSTGGGGGGFQIEPHVTRDISIPITAAGGGSEFGGGAAVRLGLRFRFLSWIVFGAGISGGIYKGSEASFHSLDEIHPDGACHLDVELGLAHRWQHLGFSLVTHPGFEVVNSYFFMPVEMSLALYPVGNFAVTAHVYGGPMRSLDESSEPAGWIAAGVGIRVHLPR